MIYVSSSCIKKRYIKNVIEDLAGNGIRNIELSGGTLYYGELKRDLLELKDKFSLNFSCHAFFPPPEKNFVVNLASCNSKIYEQTINHYERCINLLSDIGCSVLSIHAGFIVEITPETIGKRIEDAVIYNQNEAYERFSQGFGYISKLCRDRGIFLYLENNVLSKENFSEFNQNNYLMMTDSVSINEMRKRIDFELLLDLAHLYVSSNTLGLSFDKQCSELSESTRWLHISDNNGMIDQHRPLVYGSEILNQVEKFRERTRNITLETVGTVEEIQKSISLLEDKGYEL